MKVLVTGHDGYIGAVVAPLLLERGHEVHGLDSYLFEGCEFGRAPAPVQARRIDVRDIQAPHLEGFDAVVHLAAISNDPLGDLAPDVTFAVNHRASVRLAELAKQGGAERFVFASSCSLYGAASSEDVLTEDAPFNPVTPYGSSKVLVERDVSRLADDGFSPVFLRNGTVYGDSPKLRLDVVVNDLVAHGYATGEILIKSDGSPWRPLVHVGDVAQAIAACLESPRQAIHNEAFNIGRTSENFRIKDIADLIVEALPDRKVVYAGGAGPDPRCYRVNFDKALAALPGFSPLGTVRSGIRELCEAFERYRLTAAGVGEPRYQRLAHVTAHIRAGHISEDLRWAKSTTTTR